MVAPATDPSDGSDDDNVTATFVKQRRQLTTSASSTHTGSPVWVPGL